jgi:hypothetical protein
MPADLLALVGGLDSEYLDTVRYAFDVTVCVSIGSSNLTEVRKALSSASDDPAIGEAPRQGARFASKTIQAQLMVPHWVPNLAFHPMGFDLKGAWSPSSLCILDLRVSISS